MAGRPTQAQFAAVCGISRNSVVRYESDVDGANKPIVLMRWADVTGYDYEWLKGEDGDTDNSVNEPTRDTAPDTGRYAPTYHLPRAS